MTIKPCSAWTWGVLGFSDPTRIPCGRTEGHEGDHEYRMTWPSSEPAEIWVRLLRPERGGWWPNPVPYTTVDKNCPTCAAVAESNHGAWPCHRCGHIYHDMTPCPSLQLDGGEMTNDH